MLVLPTSSAITAARINPSDPGQIVTAHWSPGESTTRWSSGKEAGPSPAPDLGETQGSGRAAVFTPDGRWVGAAGQDRGLHLWALSAGGGAERVEFEPEHQHTEQVKALTAWPTTPPMIASGGDDTTVRLWTLDPKHLRQITLLGHSDRRPRRSRRGEARRRDRLVESETAADWLAFTPDGVYDSSLEGDRMVSFVFAHEVRPLEQYAEQFHKPQLTDDLRLGTRPRAPRSHTAAVAGDRPTHRASARRPATPS